MSSWVELVYALPCSLLCFDHVLCFARHEVSDVGQLECRSAVTNAERRPDGREERGVDVARSQRTITREPASGRCRSTVGTDGADRDQLCEERLGHVLQGLDVDLVGFGVVLELLARNRQWGV